MISGDRIKLDMYMMEGGSKVTMDMVFKPFTSEAWASMLLFFTTLALGYKVLARSKKCSISTHLVSIKLALTFFAWLAATVLIAFYRVVQLSFTPEIEVFCRLFDRLILS